jgi:hypothetical protein
MPQLKLIGIAIVSRRRPRRWAVLFSAQTGRGRPHSDFSMRPPARLRSCPRPAGQPQANAVETSSQQAPALHSARTHHLVFTSLPVPVIGEASAPRLTSERSRRGKRGLALRRTSPTAIDPAVPHRSQWSLICRDLKAASTPPSSERWRFRPEAARGPCTAAENFEKHANLAWTRTQVDQRSRGGPHPHMQSTNSRRLPGAQAARVQSDGSKAPKQTLPEAVRPARRLLIACKAQESNLPRHVAGQPNLSEKAAAA